jgi:2-oxoisovalerate dehydrogenase E2 component (dihydrolipoyl transacylase)
LLRKSAFRFVKEGDKVREFDRVAEVQSDKATVEITSRYDGTVKKLFYKEGDEAHVGETLLDIEVKDDGKMKGISSSKKEMEKPTRVVKGKSEPGGDEIRAMPAVRKYAKDHGIDLGHVAEVLNKTSLTVKDLESLKDKSSSTMPADENVTEKKLTPIERSMSELMGKAALIPHLGLCDDIIVKEKDNLLAKFIHYLAMLVKGTKLNSTYEGGDVLKMHNQVNVGVAIDTPHGLIVPVIHDAHNKSVAEIKSDLRELVALAKENKLPPEKFKNGTITVSNIGTISGTYARPILVAPQVCIVTLGSLSVLNGGKLILPISWAADHRVIDGASIARLSKDIKVKFLNDK